MKKIFGVILSLVICFGCFAACGRVDTEVDYDALLAKFDGELEQNVTIRVLENDMARKSGYFKILLDAFNEAYKDKGITAVDADIDEYNDLAIDGPYGLGPDILYQANDILMSYADGMHLLPLPTQKCEATEQIPDAAFKAYRLKKKIGDYTYGIPVNVQAPMLYYRKDLLPSNWNTDTTWDKNKNDIPDMTENFNEMYAYSLQVRNPATKKFGFMMSIQNAYFNTGFLLSFGAYVFGGNNDDTKDIGFANGEAEKGGQIMRQLASIMDETCIDDSITVGGYNSLGKGDYFATVSTPDTYETFIREFIKEQPGKSKEEAEKYARENLIMVDLPRIPISADLTTTITDMESETKEVTSMGGISAYGISSYTEYPKACLEFINFATSYDMITKRSEKVGIAPARKDVAEAVGGFSQTLFNKIENGNIRVMPSVEGVKQLWKPCETFFADLAKDPYKKLNEIEYDTLPKIKAGLVQLSKNVYDAINTLA